MLNNKLPMIVISVIAALFSTMNVWAVDLSHTRIHINDIYMALLMTFWMIFLESIYTQSTNYILVGFIGIGVVIFLIRQQMYVTDNQFLRGMIPHHSMAILMAQKIKEQSNDDKIIELADNIIENQKKEIDYMSQLEKRK